MDAASARLTEQAKAGIVYQAVECERCLRLAAFADEQPTLGAGMAESLRAMAAFYSHNAFHWVGVNTGAHH